ncbi:MAG: hypothetical protein OXG16_13880 [Rhodospirillales bacterium]|nr:hypothetical protein [Rhodospirillales bacterium]
MSVNTIPASAAGFTSGLGCLMVGRFSLADLVRFIPYPVAAGSCPEIGGRCA